MRRLAKIAAALVLALAAVVIVSNWTWGRLPDEPPPPPGSRYATVDGVRIHYMETPGRGPGVIMLHGHPGTWMDWDLVRAKLPGLRTVAIDRPGYGYSSGGYMPFDDQLRLIHDLAAKFQMERPVIAGHSYGGALALAYAERYRSGSSGIVAVDPAVDPDVPSGSDAAMAQISNFLDLPVIHTAAHLTFSELARTAGSELLVRAGFAPSPPNERYKRQLQSVNFKSSDLNTLAAETLDWPGVADRVRKSFDRIDTPTWLLVGRDDKALNPATVISAAQLIDHAKLWILPGGHMQTWVHPRIVALAIRRAARGEPDRARGPG